MNRLFICLATILFTASSVFAGEESVKIKEVVVTATRYKEKVTSIPANVTVITETDIENSTAQNVPDLLKTDMGIQVTDITGNKRSVRVDLRGFGATGASNTLVLVDGRRINHPDLSGVDWSQIPLDRVQKVEIIRGGRGSVLYGDNAAGGVINIITKQGGPMKAGAGVAAGSYDTYKGNVFFANRSEKVAYSLNGSYFMSDGYRENSDTNAKDLGFNLTSYVGDSLNLNFSTGYHKDNTRLPGNLKDSDFSSGASRVDTTTPNDFSEAEDFYFKVGPEYYFHDDSLLKLDVSYRKKSATAFYTGTGWTWASDTEIVTKTVSPQVVLKNKTGSMPNSLTLGVDYVDAEEDIVNNSSSSGMAEFELKKENYGYYLHDELQVTKDLLVSGGYRYDEVKFSFIPGSTNELKMDADLFTLGANYTFYKNSYVYLSYSRSFRYPVLDEMFSYSSNTVRTDIVPQKSDNYEIGMRHYFADDLYAHINLFRIDTNDEIFFNRVTYANENLDGKSRRDGVETSLYAKLHELVSLTGSYSYIDASIQGGQYKGSDVPTVPNHKATLMATVFPLKGLSIALNGIFTGKRPFNSDFENSLGDQENYLVINSKIKYQWKNITTFLDLNNLTDEEYSEFAGKSGSQKAFYPSPEFNALLGVTVEI